MIDKKNVLDLRYQEDDEGNTRLYDAGAPYTGVVIESLPSGYITATYEVKDGLKDGVEKEFYSATEVEHVAHYWKGFLHGDVIYYYPEGGLKEKSVFEYGICLEEFQWDETGQLTHHQVLELPKYQQVMLENNRKEFGK
jgi:antitoxin component YwqK of YwqJK toxin-antitoxin module